MPITTLFFDLDDTLYPAASGLWDEIRQRMNQYMLEVIGLPPAEIPAVRQMYLEKYGTTLRGLQYHHQVDEEDFLAYVHDLPLRDYIAPDPGLRGLLLSLPKKRWIFTNADIKHARRVMAIVGIEDCFEGIIDIHSVRFACKPDPSAYQTALQIAGEAHAQACVLFDDSPRNLLPARQMGFTTVLVGKTAPDPAADQVIPSLHALPQAMPQLWTMETVHE